MQAPYVFYYNLFCISIYIYNFSTYFNGTGNARTFHAGYDKKIYSSRYAGENKGGKQREQSYKKSANCGKSGVKN